VEIGKNCIIGKSSYIDRDVQIGDGVKIQNFVSIYKGVKIEDNVFIGPSVTFTNDLYPRAEQWDDNKIINTLIKKGASVGANSTIICGIKIGKYAMIGAGSVVSKHVPDFGIAYGNPARLKGFACFCGKKLDKVFEKKNKSTVFQCNCGKRVEIENKLLSEIC
jgi:UDP-2-acetamido-3-amino-2,3-dideoxy-glucuronate N-acetyltransferase